jgi:hypothetical protein
LDRCDDGGVHLFRGLDRVTPVDHQGRCVLEDDRRAGGAGEAGQPGEALGTLRHVFALVFVGAGNDEAFEATARKLGAEIRDAFGALGRRGGIIEALEAGHAGKTGMWNLRARHARPEEPMLQLPCLQAVLLRHASCLGSMQHVPESYRPRFVRCNIHMALMP